jgi:hypothetical protein
MRRSLLLAVIVLAVAAGGLWLLWPRDRVTEETYERIREGMSLEEVEQIIGGPGKVHPESIRDIIRRTEISDTYRRLYFDGDGVGRVSWTGSGSIIVIALDDKNQVCSWIYEDWRKPGFVLVHPDLEEPPSS